MFNVRKHHLESAEFAQLVDCCRSAFHPRVEGRAAELRSDLDWHRFLALARRHRVQGLVWRSLHQVRGKLPPATAEALAADARTIAANAMIEADESRRLLAAMGSAGVPILFLKGLPLAQLAYGDPFVKMAWDVDILVPFDRLSAATDVLAGAGYELLIPAGRDPDGLARWHARRKESVWRKREIHLELHTRLADNPRLLPGLSATSPEQQVTIAPGITLPTLAGDELFAYLCVHGASSAWFRLKWLADLAASIAGCTSAQVTRLYRRSQELGAGRASGHALLLARDLFGAAVEPALAEALERDWLNKWLARVAWRQMTREAEPTERPLGTSGIHLAQIALRQGIGFKLGEVRRQLADAVVNRV